MALDEGGAAPEAGGVADLIGGGAPAGGGEGGAAAEPGKVEGGGDADTSWFEKLSATADGDKPSNRDWAQSKGFKDFDAVVKSARDTEAAYRGSGAIKVPGEGAKPEEVAAFKKAIGVPDDSKGYEYTPPDGVTMNEAMLGPLRESALKHGTPASAFAGLLGDFVKLQQDQAVAETKAQDDAAQAWLKEQGGKANEQRANIDTAARALGFTKADMAGLRAGLGAARALGLLAKLGAGMGEDTLTAPGGDRRFGTTPAEAKVEMDQLRSDPEFQKKVMVKGSPERLRWDRLNAAVAEAAGKQAA